MSQPEKMLENAILDWLNSIPKCFAWKHHVGGKRGQIRTKGNRYSPNGIPDIIGLYKGRFFAIEVKHGKGKPSAEQEQQIAKILGCEGVAFWTNDLDDCKKIFNLHFNVDRNVFDGNPFEEDRIKGEKVLF